MLTMELLSMLGPVIPVNLLQLVLFLCCLKAAIAHAEPQGLVTTYPVLSSIVGCDRTLDAKSCPVGCWAGLGVLGRRRSGLILQLARMFGVS
jgi:hypothetical protein